MRRSGCGAYSITVHRLLRLFIAGGLDSAQSNILLGSFGEWFAACVRADSVCTPAHAARLRCTRVIQHAKELTLRAPSDLALQVGYFIDCHIPVITSGDMSICQVYCEHLAPEQDFHDRPIALGPPYNSTAVTEEDVVAAWFSTARSSKMTTLIKLLSKGCNRVKTIRYIGPQCERCTQTSGPAREAVREIIVAGTLGAYSHRSWRGVEMDIDKRISVYKGVTPSELQKTIVSMSARTLHGFVSEYLIGVTRLFPHVWRAVVCLIGGHQYTRSILKNETGIKLQKRKRATGGGTRIKRAKTEAGFPPLRKISTSMLTSHSPTDIVSVISGMPRPQSIPLALYLEVRRMTSTFQSVLKVSALPAATRTIQMAAAQRLLGVDTVPVVYCTVCTIVQSKFISSEKRPSKRRLGPLIQLEKGQEQYYQCSTCRSVGSLKTCNMVGKELHARGSQNSAAVAVTLCSGCSRPAENCQYFGMAPICHLCGAAPRTEVKFCICGCQKVGADAIQFRANGADGRGERLLWVCGKHKAGFLKMPIAPSYDLKAVLEAIAEATHGRSYTKSKMYLR